MSKIKLGVIGTGLMFQAAHLKALATMSNQFDIVALCNRTISNVKS